VSNNNYLIMSISTG